MIHPDTQETQTVKKLQTINTQELLEQAILNRNQTHFSQSHGTPWTMPPFKFMGSELDFNLYKDKDGNDIQIPNNTFLETKTVLELLCKCTSKTLPFSKAISFDEFTSFLTRWKESTSTSPSGQRIGIYLALVTAYKNKQNDFAMQDKSPLTYQHHRRQQISSMQNTCSLTPPPEKALQ